MIQETDLVQLQERFDRFRAKYDLSAEEVFGLLEGEDKLPVSIFNDKLSPLETVVKFLRENMDKSFKEIAGLLDKEVSSCWLAYRNSKRKYPRSYSYSYSKYDIPFDALKSGSSLLGAIVVFIKDNFEISYHDIGELLHRNEKTIWTVYNRTK